MTQKKSPADWRLYSITDEIISGGKTHLEIAQAVITGSADVIQLRDKKASSSELFEIACRLRELAHRAGVIFIVNDSLDIAVASGADGVHLGRDDSSVNLARKLLSPGMILGVSAGSTDEAIQAERDGADYIGVGPIFEARGTKSDAGEPLGLELIRQVRETCNIPIVAIGGINLQNVSSVIRAGAHSAAVISALVQVKNIAEMAGKLTKRIDAEK
ncbi:thiamine phosphate synthase [bacterium]|nr:thiamine phosphate synthase [bacterium]